MSKKATIVILGGYGISNEEFGNITHEAKTPNLSRIMKNNSSTVIKTDIGYGDKNIESSGESGYLNIGMGEKTITYYEKVNREIETGDFFLNTKLNKMIARCKEEEKNIHLIGLLSSGVTNGNTRHINAILEVAKRRDFKNVYIHLITDGIDDEPRAAYNHIKNLENSLEEKGVGKIATVCGRKYAMDKTGNFEYTKKAYLNIYNLEGKVVSDISVEIEEQYLQDKIDRNIEPFVMKDIKKVDVRIKEGDGIIFTHLRQDRINQMLEAFVDPYFSKFETAKDTQEILTLTPNPIYKTKSIIEKEEKKSLIEKMIEKKVNLLKIYENYRKYELNYTLFGEKDLKTEIEKYNEKKENQEEKIEYGKIYDVIPTNLKEKEYVENIRREIINFANIVNLKNREIDEILEKEEQNAKRLTIVDFSNLDVLANLIELEGIRVGLEAIDEAIQIIENQAEKNGEVLIITSTHGCIENMIDKKTGEINTKNTKNPLPFIYVNSLNKQKVKTGSIYNILPTVCDIMGIEELKEGSLIVG